MEKRIEDLEVRLAFFEKTVDDLNEVVRELADELGSVRDEVKALRQAMGRNVEASEDLAEDKPPHW